MIHWIAHLLGINNGTTYSWIEDPYELYGKSKIMMSFKCTKCGDLSGVHKGNDIIHAELQSKEKE